MCRCCGRSWTEVTRSSYVRDYCIHCERRYASCFQCEACHRFYPMVGGSNRPHLCNVCVTEYSLCATCDCVCLNTNINNGICSDCLNSNLVECAECGSLEDNEDLIDGFCSLCYENCVLEYDKITPEWIDKSKMGFLTPRPFAVELEVIDPDRKLWQELSNQVWKLEDDRSLSEGGVEYIGGPFAGQQAIDQITAWSTNAKKMVTVDVTCGFHLHFDCTRESESTIEKFVRFCVQIQNSVADLVSPSRQRQFKNLDDDEECRNYCVELPPYPENLSLENYVYNVCGDGIISKNSKYSIARYRWLNIHSYFYRGTLEIRLHQGTYNSEKILAWVELWLKLFEYIKYATEYPMTNVIDYFNLIGLRKSTTSYFLKRISQFSHIN